MRAMAIFATTHLIAFCRAPSHSGPLLLSERTTGSASNRLANGTRSFILGIENKKAGPIKPGRHRVIKEKPRPRIMSAASALLIHYLLDGRRGAAAQVRTAFVHGLDVVRSNRERACGEGGDVGCRVGGGRRDDGAAILELHRVRGVAAELRCRCRGERRRLTGGGGV